MKRILIVLVAVFSAAGLVKAQINVDCNGHVGIGIVPNTAYNLNLRTMIITAGSPYSDIIINENPQNYGNRAIYPSLDFSGEIGTSTRRFFNVYAKNHYATNSLLASDKRLKENFRTIDQPLNKILQMNGAMYDFISQGTDTIKDEKEKQKRLRLEKNRLGFIAQDLEKIMPEAVFYFTDEDRYYIDYNAIIPVIVEALKEQQARIEELNNVVANFYDANLKSATLVPGTTHSTDLIKAELYQNTPNPFSQTTTIRYSLADNVQKAMICIYDMNGAQLKCIPLDITATGSITINGNELKPGMYMYSLIADGQLIDTKRMVLTE